MRNIQTLILEDTGFIGQVARGVRDGLSYRKIATNAGHKTTMMTFVWLKTIRVLMGQLPYEELKPQMKTNVYRKAQTYSKSPSLTPDELHHLQQFITLYEQENNVAPSNTHAAPETTSPSRQDTPQQPQNTFQAQQPILSSSTVTTPITPSSPGVYVYTYSLYLDNPISPEDGRTLFKIGASHVDVHQRLAAQKNQTPVPDDMQTLRIFSCGDAIKEEQKFHRILTAAVHHHDNPRAGTEWFLTRLELIDAIAESLGLFDSFEQV